MAENYYIGVYWGARRESVEQCAEQAAQFLTCIAQVHPALARWFKPAASIKKALAREVRPHPTDLRRMLLAGRSRPDEGDGVIEEIGFLFSLWNGGVNQEDSVGLNIACGGFSPWVPNSCVFGLPSQGELLEHILTIPMLRSLLSCMIHHWLPDWGIVGSDSYRTIANHQQKAGPQIGWITYLSERCGSLPPLPALVQVVSVDGLGSLILTTDERFTASNPVHVETANQIADVLCTAGMLRPLT